MICSVCDNYQSIAAVNEVGIHNNDGDVGCRSADAELGSERDNEKFDGCVGDHVGWTVPL